ncbi:MAG: hypothetical protein KME07_18500 [Pegethrix bostrychoides GSE-TBD4-15B]|jgi:hypothetical protein|uniref:Uncharacterized protein n=1 Tax=Pegethrix bostrychoides GSE-TBD4-15B TaxID=2839662 RepID=A0A951PD64_9CYAN|nr:hypothetical protein [Pegethrix bostrychoides GSE-TBD4-15B]
MNLRRLFAVSILFTSSLPVFASAASAQVYGAPRFYPSEVSRVNSQTPFQTHSFELFNNSWQDILYLHIYSDSNPDDIAVYGGIRQLPPGRAWKVNLLGRECIYNVAVEYENGSQSVYSDVNTCDYQGIEIQ